MGQLLSIARALSGVMSDTSSAEGTTHNLQGSAASLASDPVSNLSQLLRLQSAQSGRHQQMFANCMAGVLPNTVVHSNSKTSQLDTDALQAMVAEADGSYSSSGLQHQVTDEQSRVALSVLLLGVWADKLPGRLGHARVSEASEDNHCSSGQVATGDSDSSAVPALAHAPAAAAATSPSAAPSASPSASPSLSPSPSASAPASSSTSTACAPATVSASASASASESAGHGEVAPCSTTAEAASQPLPLPCLMSHTSLGASNIGEEEDEEEEKLEAPSISEVSGSTAPLRQYQQEALDKINQGSNHIVVAPTGSGKTRIAVELAGQLLRRKPQAKVVFLATTVALAQQQAGVFEHTDCIREQYVQVQCFIRSARITAQRWRIAIFADSVLVMTAQQLLNMLNLDVAALQQIDLLIMDECHHCTKDAPYNHIMQKYKHLSEEDKAKTQVLGLTASPGGDADEAGAVRAQWTLRQNMCAEYVWIDPKRPEVSKLVPRASDHIKRVDPRQEDVSVATAVARVVLRHVESLTVGMSEKLPGLHSPPLPVRTNLLAGKWSPELRSWFRSILDSKDKFPILFASYVGLLQDCNSTAFLAMEYGYEMALPCLGHSCLAACDRSYEDAAAAGVVDKQPQPSNVVQALLWDLATSVCNMSRVCKALAAAHDSAYVHFPKFRSLVDILSSMIHSKDTFHGVVFVRRRQGVHVIASMLSKEPSIATAVTLHTFTGHSGKTKVQLAREGGETAGMPTTAQQEAVEKFDRGEGREVMVATAAFQEGLDICNCSFVVCYNVTERGVQLMQWRGRTRKFDSQLFLLIEAGSQDEAMLGKSIAEEKNDHLAQIQLSS